MKPSVLDFVMHLQFWDMFLRASVVKAPNLLMSDEAYQAATGRILLQVAHRKSCALTHRVDMEDAMVAGFGRHFVSLSPLDPEGVSKIWEDL